jgi:hypothetical protein
MAASAKVTDSQTFHTRLDARSLRPSCINNRSSGGMCGGEMRHASVESDAAVFRCEQCGTQLKSRWW